MGRWSRMGTNTMSRAVDKANSKSNNAMVGESMGGWITRRAALWAPGSLGGTGLDEAPAAIRSNSDTLRLQLRRGCDEGKVGVHGRRAALDVRASRYERVGRDGIGRRATAGCVVLAGHHPLRGRYHHQQKH